MREIDLSVRDCVSKLDTAARQIYQALGPGHKEEIYQAAFAIELKKLDYKYVKERTVEVLYSGQCVGYGAADFVVYPSEQHQVVVEFKTVPNCGKGHKQQLRCYMDALNADYGMLINFWKPTATAKDEVKDDDLLVVKLKPESPTDQTLSETTGPQDKTEF